MEVISIKNKNEWDSKMPFTQSWEWGDVLISEGKEIERLIVKEGEKILACAQIVYSALPFGWKYAFCPKGPVLEQNRAGAFEAILEYLKKQKGVIFFRIEPNDKPTNLSCELKRTIDVNPPATLILDLTKNEEDILNGMHSKTRYNIRLAEKKNLKIVEDKNFDAFLSLMRKTGDRDNFKLHHIEHYKNVLNLPLVKQFTAYQDNVPLACIVCVGFGETFTYLYGASDYQYRNLMAPYLLQWNAIQKAKTQGFKKYDFFGVAPRINSSGETYEYDPKHQYAGVTRFKLGFGGYPSESAGTWDILVDRKKYFLYSLIRKLRRLM